MLYLSITYSKEFFMYQTRKELYKAMDRMDFGAFDVYAIENANQASAFYAFKLERYLTNEEKEAIRKMYEEAKGEK